MYDEPFSRGGLSLDRLRNFLALASSGSIAKAAPGDVTRQSQISRQVGELVAFFATELTVRRGQDTGAIGRWQTARCPHSATIAGSR